MRILFFLFFLIPYCNANAAFDAALEQKDSVEILPQSRPFPVLWADPRDIKTGLRKNSHQEIEADVGFYRSILGYKVDNRVYHFGIEGNGYFLMRRSDSRFPLISSDGLVGLYAEATEKGYALQLRYTHISAHISDDGIASGRVPINYSREFFNLRGAREFHFLNTKSFYYLGYRYLVHTVPESIPKHGGQFGFQSILPRISQLTAPYLAFDYTIRSAYEGSTWVASTGLAIFSSQKNGASPLRVSFSYLSGHDPRGQFFGQRLKKLSTGLEFDL